MQKNKINWLLSIVLLVVVLLVIFPTVASAAFDISKGIIGNISYKCRELGKCGFCDWIDLFMTLQKVILSLFGGLAVVLMVWAGLSLIIAAGNEEKIKEAKKLMTSTIIGIVMVLAGYFLVSIIIGVLLRPAADDSSTKGLPVTLFGVNWSNAYCRDKGDPKYCESRSVGNSCGKYSDGTCQKQGSKNVCIVCADLPNGAPCGKPQNYTVCHENQCKPACVGPDNSFNPLRYFICMQIEKECTDPYPDGISGTVNLDRVCTEIDSPVCCSAP